MKRLLIRKDHDGNPVVFLPDTLQKDGTIQAWYGQHDKDPEVVTYDYYLSTRFLDDNDEEEKKIKARLQKQAEKKFPVPIFLMQRFPRGLAKAILEEKEEAQQATVKAPEHVVQGPVVSEAEKAHYRAVKAVRAGKLWELQDANGETVEIVADKMTALRSLEQQAMLLH